VELFFSTYVNKVDRKGRVSVPATFRSTLATSRQPNLIVAFLSLYLPAVECAGSDRMEEMQEQIETLEQFSDDYENLMQMFADSHPMMMDPEGRVILPEQVKEYAGIDTDVAFVGHGRMFQLWNPARYEEHRAAVRERARQQGTKLPARAGVTRRPNGGEA
jgi:MraZ protein